MENVTAYLLIFIGFLFVLFVGAFIYKTQVLGESFTFKEPEVNESEFGNPIKGNTLKEKEKMIEDPKINPPELGGVVNTK
jgi:hypothetical protein